jgi:hypothetical protein
MNRYLLTVMSCTIVATWTAAPALGGGPFARPAECLTDVEKCTQACSGVNRSIARTGAVNHAAKIEGKDTYVAADPFSSDYGIFRYSSHLGDRYFYNLTGSSATAECLNVSSCEAPEEAEAIIQIVLELVGHNITLPEAVDQIGRSLQCSLP